MLEEFKPGAMLLDLAMPDVSGFDVAEQLQERPELRPSLLIALTGLGDKKTRLATE
jgi:CheY-like chemotaxis protein